MKRTIVLVGLLLSSISAYAVDMIIAGRAQGYEHNSTLNRTLSRELSVWVSGSQLQVTANNSAAGTFVDFDADVPARAAEFSAILAKAIKWTEIAIENKADVAKEVGVVKDRGSVTFTFYSSADVQMLKVEIADWDNQFKSSEAFLLGIDGIKEFKQVFDNIDKVHQEVLAREKNEALFN